MKIIIVGDGKVGLALTRQLSREDHDITVIDSNPRVNETLEKYDVMIVNGNGASLETLREAGVAEADLVIAATSSDEINMLCCVTAKYFADVHCPRAEPGLCRTAGAAAQPVWSLHDHQPGAAGRK